MHLPPGMTAQQFAGAVQRLKEVVGDEWVFTSDEDIYAYRDSYTPFVGESGEYMPSGGVAPDSTEQVQRVVAIANQFKLPLWPISTGKNLGYGGSAPRLSGTMIQQRFCRRHHLANHN